jgi:hypothetical protein
MQRKRAPKKAFTAEAGEPSGIAALIERARLTTFWAKYPPGDVYRRVWVQETVPRHGYHAGFLPDVVEDWTSDIGSQVLANAILWYCEQLGLLSESKRLRITHLFAIEVCSQLGENFRLCALHVLLWIRRDMGGYELVREAQSAAE